MITTFIQTRLEGFEIDAMAIVELTSQITDRDLLWENFRAAISQWVKTTPDGKRCWEESSGYLNIGDLLNDSAFTNRNLISLLKKYKIEKAQVESVWTASFKTYDEVLVDDPEEL